MNRIQFSRIFVASITLICVSNSMQRVLPNELLSREQWDLRATSIFSKVDRVRFADESVNLLSPVTKSTLWDILTSSETPVLRLAAYNSLSSRSPKDAMRALITLLAYADSIFFYEDQFHLLRQPGRVELIPPLVSLLSSRLEEKHQTNILVILRLLSDQSLETLLRQVLNGSAPATNLASIASEMCRRNPNWNATKLRQDILPALSELATAPGPAQLSYIAYFPFDNPDDVFPHLRIVFEDESLKTPELLIAVSRFGELLNVHETVLLESPRRELVKSRIEEFKRRIQHTRED